MEFQVQSRSPTLKRYVEALMPSLIKQLKLERSRKFVLIEIGSVDPAYIPGDKNYLLPITLG